MTVNRNTLAVKPRIARRAVRKCDMRAACAILVFQKGNVAFAVLLFLELTIDAVFTVFNIAPFLENGINIFL